MANKTNGIDVSDCKWFNRFSISSFKIDDCVRKESGEINQCRINNRFYGQEFYCEDNPDCYFKQLKRLQEENEGLKEKITKFKWDNPYYDLYNNVVGQRDNLKKENEELKKRCEELNKMTGIFSARLADKYKQALKEIRGIAEKLITETPEYNSCYYKDECGDNCTPKQHGKVAYCCFENVEKIEKLINEVLNEK